MDRQPYSVQMEPTAQSLARTYSDRVYPDPWEKVTDYRRVREYVASHPDAGRTKVGNALDLPPGRVRGWINDGMPDPVRGIQTAIDHGWLNPDPDSEIAGALVKLAAHIMAGGSISASWVPAVSVGRQVTQSLIKDAFDAVEVQTTTRHTDSDRRATEVVAREDATVLGRCLSCMGVPQGTKTDVESLPSVLQQVPGEIQQAYAQVVVLHRGINYDDKDTTRVMSERPAEYHDAVANLIRTVTGESATSDERGVTVSAAAARTLDVTE